jgi:hypothetical protein
MEDSAFEIFLIPIPAGLALEHPDFTVHGLQFSGIDRVIVPIQNKGFPKV